MLDTLDLFSLLERELEEKRHEVVKKLKDLDGVHNDVVHQHLYTLLRGQHIAYVDMTMRIKEIRKEIT